MGRVGRKLLKLSWSTPPTNMEVHRSLGEKTPGSRLKIEEPGQTAGFFVFGSIYQGAILGSMFRSRCHMETLLEFVLGGCPWLSVARAGPQRWAWEIRTGPSIGRCSSTRPSVYLVSHFNLKNKYTWGPQNVNLGFPFNVDPILINPHLNSEES